MPTRYQAFAHICSGINDAALADLLGAIASEIIVRVEHGSIDPVNKPIMDCTFQEVCDHLTPPRRTEPVLVEVNEYDPDSIHHEHL